LKLVEFRLEGGVVEKRPAVRDRGGGGARWWCWWCVVTRGIGGGGDAPRLEFRGCQSDFVVGDIEEVGR
jgi:hypothetical protein